MARGKSYTFGSYHFEKQSDLDAAVKAALNSHPVNTEFNDEFLALVINTYHQEVIRAGQECSGLFEYLDFREQQRRGMDTSERYRGGKVLRSLFSPLGEWRDVTCYPYRKPINPEQDIKRSLREIASRFIPHPKSTDRCTVNGCQARGNKLEYEHVAPTFDEIATRCLSLMTPEEIATEFGYSKFSPGKDELAFLIPPDHVAVIELEQAHIFNQWTWLCAFHHRNVTV